MPLIIDPVKRLAYELQFQNNWEVITHLDDDRWGVWVSGKQGHWLPDPLEPLKLYSVSLDQRATAQTLTDAMRGTSKGETYVVCTMREGAE